MLVAYKPASKKSLSVYDAMQASHLASERQRKSMLKHALSFEQRMIEKKIEDTSRMLLAMDGTVFSMESPMSMSLTGIARACRRTTYMCKNT